MRRAAATKSLLHLPRKSGNSCTLAVISARQPPDQAPGAGSRSPKQTRDWPHFWSTTSPALYIDTSNRGQRPHMLAPCSAISGSLCKGSWKTCNSFSQTIRTTKKSSYTHSKTAALNVRANTKAILNKLCLSCVTTLSSAWLVLFRSNIHRAHARGAPLKNQAHVVLL